MKQSWEAVIKDIRARNPIDIYHTINFSDEFEVDPSAPKVQLADSIENTFMSEILLHGEKVFEFTERDGAFVEQCIISLNKFVNVLNSAKKLAANGFLTWALVDAYHAILLGGRSIAAFYGILPLTIGKKSILVDLRPELGLKEQQRLFNKQYRVGRGWVKAYSIKGAEFGQKETWTLTKRLAATTPDDVRCKVQLESLNEIVKRQFDNVRNQLLYDASYWLELKEFRNLCPMTEDDIKDYLFSASDGVQDIDLALKDICNILLILYNNLCDIAPIKEATAAISWTKEFKKGPLVSVF
jgi:hypothetical protein